MRLMIASLDTRVNNLLIKNYNQKCIHGLTFMGDKKWEECNDGAVEWCKKCKKCKNCQIIVKNATYIYIYIQIHM